MFRGGLGTPEILLILAVVVLLFGAKKLPDLARGSGRALRIFKAETKGLMDDDEKDDTSTRPASAAHPALPPVDPSPVDRTRAGNETPEESLRRLRDDTTP